ncbi:MAG: DUF2726 domain-containing protein [Clostridium sp.]
MVRRLTQEEFESRVKENSEGNIKVLGNYKNKRTKVKVKCEKCGYIWDANPEPLWNGHGCPKCANNILKTTEKFKKEVYNLTGNEYSILSEYQGASKKVKFKHNKCGNEFEMNPKDFLRGQRCPNERYEKSAKSNIEIQGKPKEKNKLLEEICLKENYEIIKGYTNAKTKLILKHLECGKIFEVSPYGFIYMNIRCSCKNRSKGEQVIKEWLDLNDYNYIEQYRIKECKNKRALPFDFAVFENNKLIFLIEFDGEQHETVKFNFNSEGEALKNFNKQQENDKIKNEFCKNNKIPLIRIKYNKHQKFELFKEKIICDLIKKIDKYKHGNIERSLIEISRTCND